MTFSSLKHPLSSEDFSFDFSRFSSDPVISAIFSGPSDLTIVDRGASLPIVTSRISGGKPYETYVLTVVALLTSGQKNTTTLSLRMVSPILHVSMTNDSHIQVDWSAAISGTIVDSRWSGDSSVTVENPVFGPTWTGALFSCDPSFKMTNIVTLSTGEIKAMDFEVTIG